MTGPAGNTDVEIAVQAATSFVQLYYAAYDSGSRTEDVPKFYREYSAVSWNGNAITGAEGVSKLLKEMPSTAHSVQSFDCHPVPNTDGPLLMVSVSGTVQHGPGVSTSGLVVGEKKEKGKNVEGQQRVFGQTFVLTRDKTAESGEGKLGKYVIKADTMRFVG